LGGFLSVIPFELWVRIALEENSKLSLSPGNAGHKPKSASTAICHATLRLFSLRIESGHSAQTPASVRFGLLAQPIDATQALDQSAGV
jgi:hypothetical protein